MKNCVFVLLVLWVSLGSCKKKTTVEANLTAAQKVSRTWICAQADVLSTTRQTIYKKGQSANLISLDNSFITFKADGTYEAIDFNQQPTKGKWVLKNNDKLAELDDWDYDFDITNLTSKVLEFNTKLDYNEKTYDVFVKMEAK